MHFNPLKPVVISAAALALSACVSLGGMGGGYPDQGSNYPQQGYPTPGYPAPSNAPLQVEQGTVDATDHNNGRFRIRTDRGAMLELVYDNQTVLIYQGQQVAVSGLEPGDGIRVEFRRIGDGRYYAQRIDVLRNVRGNTSSSGTLPTYGGARPAVMNNTAISGPVIRNDSQAKVLEFNRGTASGPREYVRYDAYTIVEYNGSRQAANGQRYSATQLEPGDVIRIDGRPMGNEVLAERIVVTRAR